MTLAALICLPAIGSAQEPPQQPELSEQERQAALERALAELPEAPPQDLPGPADNTLWQSNNVRLYDLSLDGMFTVGGSTADDETLGYLEAGGHDPRQRGFNVQQVELGLAGAVDPYFTADVFIIYHLDGETGESHVELEEAYATSSSLPYGLELRAGQMLTEFGRQNPRHPHQWTFLDASVINTRIFGPEGMRSPGARLSWLTPLPWYTEATIGVQNARGDAMASFLSSEEYFEEIGIGGRPWTDQQTHSLSDFAWLARLATSWDPWERTSVALGLSGMFGSNATGDGGQTEIYGADMVWFWTDGEGGRQADSLRWTTEFIYRRYHADSFTDEGDPSDPNDDVLVPADTLLDYGLYTELDYRFASQWSVGLRFDWAQSEQPDWDSSSQTFVSTADDPYRDRRIRISPMITWTGTEHSRVRLQYNYDRSEFLEEGDAHTIWLGLEVAIGPHAAHRF